MAKTRTHWICQNCGRTSPREMGRCPGCGEWGTMVEVLEKPSGPAAGLSAVSRSEPHRLTEIETEGLERLPLPMEEFSRVLGGGVVPGSLILVSGDPGIGKSTLLLQIAGLMAEATSRPVLYVSGEESARQIKMRADRLAVRSDDLFIVTETRLEAILRHAEKIQPVIILNKMLTFVKTTAFFSVVHIRQSREYIMIH